MKAYDGCNVVVKGLPLKSNFLSLNSFSLILGEKFNCCELQFSNMYKGSNVVVVYLNTDR